MWPVVGLKQTGVPRCEQYIIVFEGCVKFNTGRLDVVLKTLAGKVLLGITIMTTRICIAPPIQRWTAALNKLKS